MQSNIQWIEIVHGPTTVRIQDKKYRDFTGITQAIIRSIVAGVLSRQHLTLAKPFSGEILEGAITIRIMEDLLHTQKVKLAAIIFDDFDVLGYSYL